MSCAIFEAFATATDVGRKIDALVQTLAPAFLPLKVEFAENEDDLSLWVPQSYTAHLKVPSLRADRKERGQIAIHFDLARPGMGDGDWPWSRSALVVVAYATSYDAGWVSGQLAVQADGRLGYETTADLERFAGNRLLATAAPRSNRWSDAEWVYALPLRALGGAEALQTEIVAPVTSLLVLDVAPEKALAGTSAVGWPGSELPVPASLG